MKKYRIKPYDLVDNTWILEEHVFWFFWRYRGCGPKAKLEAILEELQCQNH